MDPKMEPTRGQPPAPSAARPMCGALFECTKNDPKMDPSESQKCFKNLCFPCCFASLASQKGGHFGVTFGPFWGLFPGMCCQPSDHRPRASGTEPVIGAGGGLLGAKICHPGADDHEESPVRFIEMFRPRQRWGGLRKCWARNGLHFRPQNESLPDAPTVPKRIVFLVFRLKTAPEGGRFFAQKMDPKGAKWSYEKTARSAGF